MTSPSNRQRHRGNNSEKERSFLTDAQRDQIDAESKSTLRDLNAGIRQLEEVDQLRKDTERQIAASKRSRKNFGALGRWAAGNVNIAKSPEEQLEEARQNTVNTHRESVIWYLRRKLEDATETQRGMMETRLEREIEKSKSALYKVKGIPGFESRPSSHANDTSFSTTNAGASSNAVAVAEDEQRSIEQSLSPEQLQLFAKENNDMLKHYEDTLDQVRTAEKSMVEISELQTTLAQNLEIQATRIDQLVEDSANTEQNVLSGNKQLKKASEAFRWAPLLFYVSCGLSAFLITWDLFI
jgi:syntaxin 18